MANGKARLVSAERCRYGSG